MASSYLTKINVFSDLTSDLAQLETKTTDIGLIQTVLKKLDLNLLECQSQIYGLVKAVALEFASNASTGQTLIAQLAELKRGITALSEAVRSSQTEHLLFGQDLRADLAQCESEVDILKHVVTLLDGFLSIHSAFTQYDESVGNQQLDAASDAIHRAAAALDEVLQTVSTLETDIEQQSGPHGVVAQAMLGCEEIFFIRSLRSHMISRKTQLELALFQNLQRLCRVYPNRVVVTKTVSEKAMDLAQLWRAAKYFPDLVEKVMHQLVGAMILHIVDPLLSTASSMKADQTLATEVRSEKHFNSSDDDNDNTCPLVAPAPHRDQHTCSVWVWMIQPVKSEDPQGVADPFSAAISVLKELLRFIASDLFQGHPDLLSQFGTTFWTHLSGVLQSCMSKKLIPTFPDRLKKLEADAKALQLIPPEMSLLANYCSQYSLLMLETHCQTILSQIRAHCLSETGSMKTVGTDVDHDPFRAGFEILQHKLTDRKTGSQWASLHSYLEKNPFSLPKCKISEAAFETVAACETLLQSTLTSAQTSRTLNDKLLDGLVMTVQNAIMLFILLRSLRVKDTERGQVATPALFFCDLFYLTRKIILFNAHVDKDIATAYPKQFAQLSMVDVLLTIRPLQSEVFQSMMADSRDLVVQKCYQIDSLVELSLDANYLVVESQLGDILQSVKRFASVWKEILPSDLAALAIGKLVDLFLTALLQVICDQFEASTTACSPDNMNAFIFTLNTVKTNLKSSLGLNAQAIDSICHVWRKFELFVNLLTADVPEFWSLKQDIRTTLTPQQIKIVLEISSSQRSLSTKDILRLLSTE